MCKREVNNCLAPRTVIPSVYRNIWEKLRDGWLPPFTFTYINVPLQKRPKRRSGQKVVLKVKLVSVITVPFVSSTWKENEFYTNLAKNKLVQTGCNGCQFNKFYQEILFVPIDYTCLFLQWIPIGKASQGTNDYLLAKAERNKNENMLPSCLNSFSFLQSIDLNEWKKGSE